MKISFVSILLLLGMSLPVWATSPPPSPCTSLLKTYSKRTLISVIRQARGAAITIEVEGRLRESIGIPQEKYVTARSVYADVSAMHISLKEFEELIHTNQQEEEAYNRRLEETRQQHRKEAERRAKQEMALERARRQQASNQAKNPARVRRKIADIKPIPKNLSPRQYGTCVAGDGKDTLAICAQGDRLHLMMSSGIIVSFSAKDAQLMAAWAEQASAEDIMRSTLEGAVYFDDL